MKNVLADEALDADEMLARLLSNSTWPQVDASLRALLRDENEAALWPAIVGIYWAAVLDKRETEINSLIALLWHRRPELTLEENLVWSVISKLKNLDYLANYDAERDANVARELALLRNVK